MTDQPTREYLGGGIYAEFDGYRVMLRAGSYTAAPVIAIDPQVLEALNAFYEKVIEGPFEND